MRLTTRDLQRLLHSVGAYSGGIDGDYGPKTRAAVTTVLERNRDRIPRGRISSKRMGVMAAQIILADAGYEPGTIDGYDGHNTSEAFNAWAFKQETGRDEDFRGDQEGSEDPTFTWPSQSRVRQFYGDVGENQGRVELPYTMKLAWNTRQKVNRFSCHQKVVEPMRAIFEQTLDHYGLDGVKELRLDYFGGCLNVRKMRGGSAYSMHSWGIAVDLDPANNRLRWGRDRATFAKPEYAAFWDIVEGVGAISLGRKRNFDWMHFQFANI